MFSNYFSVMPLTLSTEAACARQQRQREAENALLSHLISGFQPTREAIAILQAYIDGEKSREKAFSALYEAH